MKNKKLFNLFLLCLLLSTSFTTLSAYGQAVSISNTTGATPNASAILDIVASDKGILIPRVALDDATTADPVTTPADGLIIYNATGTEPQGFYYWDGTKWNMLTSSNNTEVSNYQDTDQEPTGLIQCSNNHSWFVNLSSSIPDPGTLDQNMTSLTQSGNICDINVIIDITHTYDGDLDIYLESPEGTTIDLSTGNGGSEDNYSSTTFDDDASTSITSGSAPFNGTYSPEGLLSDFNGESPTGTWILHIRDNTGGDAGTLNRVDLIITTTEESPWEFLGEATITYKAGSTPVVSAYYSANPTFDTGNKIRISRSTTSGSGDVGTALAYSATSPPQGNSGTIQGETTEFWISMNAFYHDDAVLTDQTIYYYKLWKAGEAESGQENYSIVPILSPLQKV